MSARLSLKALSKQSRKLERAREARQPAFWEPAPKSRPGCRNDCAAVQPGLGKCRREAGHTGDHGVDGRWFSLAVPYRIGWPTPEIGGGQ